MKKLLALALLLPTWLAAQKPRLFILSIGVSKYQSTSIGNLNYADNDARDLAAAFQKQTAMWNIRETKVLTDDQATRKNIRDELDRFATLVNSSDFFIFSFSGHGGDERLLPFDTDVLDPEVSTISKEFLFKKLDALGCGYLVFLDACHSGSFARNSGLDSRAETGEIDFDIRKLVDALAARDKPYIVFGSSASNQLSYESKELENGYFAQTILDALDNKPAHENGGKYTPDANGDGKLNTYELDDYLKNAVRIRTIPLGKPQKVYSKLTQGEARNLFRVATARDPEPPQPTDRDGDGVPDKTDDCPTVFGTRDRRGCPDDDPVFSETDTDRDGISNDRDGCPTEFGTAKANGCPDYDDDGVPDKSDACPQFAGKPNWQGCPDSDGDGIHDGKDDCPRQVGNLANRGCPDPDRDGDGVPDISDKCPDEAGKLNLSGCPEDPMGLVFVKGGTFIMGCTSDQQDCRGDESPAHEVTLSDFFIGKYEVTQQQWTEIMGNNPSNYSSCDQCPVDNVSWDDIQDFLKKLNQKYRTKNYRLPTEAEWEYAARGGGKLTLFGNGKNIADPAEINFEVIEQSLRPYSKKGINRKKAVPVGSLNSPNSLGLHDMSGNVWEWCSDCWGSYSSEKQTNPKGATSNLNRVMRGGSWLFDAQRCRVSHRYYNLATVRYSDNGFRLASSLQ